MLRNHIEYQEEEEGGVGGGSGGGDDGSSLYSLFLIFQEDYYCDRNGDGIPIRWLAPEVMSFSENDVVLGRITRDSNIWYEYRVICFKLVLLSISFTGRQWMSALGLNLYLKALHVKHFMLVYLQM